MSQRQRILYQLYTDGIESFFEKIGEEIWIYAGNMLYLVSIPDPNL